MDRFVVEGREQLKGRLRISGAKNSALKLMVGALLGQGTFHLEDVPQITDVLTMCGVLQAIGVDSEFEGNVLKLQVNSLQGQPPQELAKSMRASIQVMGPLLAKLGWVEVAKPGGCAIGSRPLDLHLNGLAKMGARIHMEDEVIIARAKQLHGADITLRYPSVGATENIMMAAVLARGETIIRNAAREPEIGDVQAFLNKMGARIEGAGTSLVRIRGVKELGEVSFRVIPDRIEAGTYILAALISGGEITLENVIPEHLEALLCLVRKMGAQVESQGDELRIGPAVRSLKPFQIETSPHPGFPTDLQPQLVALASQIQGLSQLKESVFDRRFGYTSELKKMGARIKIGGDTAFIRGRSVLKGTEVEIHDLRAGAALILAALAAEGVSTIGGAGHIDRGYEKIEHKLSRLGARIKRIASTREG